MGSRVLWPLLLSGDSGPPLLCDPYKGSWTWALATDKFEWMPQNIVVPRRNDDETSATKPSTSCYLPRPRLLLRLMLRFVERYSRPRTVRGGELAICEAAWILHDETPRGNKQPRSMTNPDQTQPHSEKFIPVWNWNNIFEIIFSWDIDYVRYCFWDINLEILVLRYRREILIAREILIYKSWDIN